jgi:hypothetical protein
MLPALRVAEQRFAAAGARDDRATAEGGGMRVGLALQTFRLPVTRGGAEFTQAEFRAAAPELDVESRSTARQAEFRAAVPKASRSSTEPRPGPLRRPQLRHVHPRRPQAARRCRRRVVKYWHDVGPWLTDDVKAWIEKETLQVCCSPIQAEHMGTSAIVIPPPVDLERFSRAAEGVNGTAAAR